MVRKTESGAPEPTWFFPVPSLKLLLLATVGGEGYLLYWMYMNWDAYRRAWGYSRRPFWRSVYRRTGYHVNPLLRAILHGCYVFCLFPGVERECRSAGVRGVVAPVWLAMAFQVLQVIATAASSVVGKLVFWPLLVLLPVQLAINRLNSRAGTMPGFRFSAPELLIVALGAGVRWFT